MAVAAAKKATDTRAEIIRRFMGRDFPSDSECRSPQRYLISLNATAAV
jgi:hypothetical protein